MGVTKEQREKIKEERIGLVLKNNKNEFFKIIEYNNSSDITIQFLDDYQCLKHTNWTNICSGKISNPHHSREGKISTNYQNYKMKIIYYKNNMDIIVEFQDKWKAKVHTRWDHFISGNVKNPYAPLVYNRGMTGEKYITYENGDNTKEYTTWYNLFIRCYDQKLHLENKNRAYIDCNICDQWFLYDNFYEWLHSQDNFNKWFNGMHWDIDKDILIKNNKIYSSDKCLLVPKAVNELFLKNKWNRGEYPIGVSYRKDTGCYTARCNNPLTKEREYLGSFTSENDAFNVYKNRKEKIIKQVAEKEFHENNITEKCYIAMINYEVDIHD